MATSFAQTKVGIGTTNPQKMLSMYQGMNLDQANAGDGTNLTNGLSFGETAQTGIASNWSALNFIVNGVSRLWIAADGNIGLGGVTPNNALIQMRHLGKYAGYYFDNDAHAIMIQGKQSGFGNYDQILKIGVNPIQRLSYINADSANYVANCFSTLLLHSRG